MITETLGFAPVLRRGILTSIELHFHSRVESVMFMVFGGGACCNLLRNSILEL